MISGDGDGAAYLIAKEDIWKAVTHDYLQQREESRGPRI